MHTVYGMAQSGNCYKIKLLLEQLRLPYRWVEVDVVGGATRTPEFLTKNPNGKVPLLETPNGDLLPESNAILFYLAEGSELLPDGRLQRARVLQWMFFEQYSHEPYIAVARFIRKFLPLDHPRQAEMAQLHERGYRALDVMEQHLGTHEFFGGEAYSIADIALYAYTHVAVDGGFDLARYSATNSWLERVRRQKNHVAIG